MQLIVDRIEASPTQFDFEVAASWLRERLPHRDGAPGIAEPFRFGLQAHRIGESLYLEGRAEGALELTCGRCLTRYREPIREEFRLVLEPAEGRVPADPEGAEALQQDGLYLADELEAGWFQGSQIDLGRFVVEMVALGWPVQPLCKEDCQGLCPRCGADRNLKSCECEEAPSGSPFAVLEQLKGRLQPPDPEGES